MIAIKNVLKAAGIVAMASGLALAQQAAPAPDAGLGHRFEHRGAHHMAMGKLMAGYLGLTDDQQAKAKAIFTSARESAKPVRDQLRQARQDLRTAIQNGQPVDQLAANEGNLMGKLAGIRASAAEQFRALLTPQQVQKLEQLHQGRRAQG